MGRMRLSVQFLLRPLKRTRRSQCPWRAAARRVPVCARAAWSWRAPSGRSRPGPRRCGPLGNRAHRVGPRRRGARPPGASGGSNISPITAAWSKWAGVSRCRASTTANHGSVSPIRTSLSPSRNGPSTPRRTSAAIRRTPRAGKPWPVQAIAAGAGKDRMRSANDPQSQEGDDILAGAAECPQLEPRREAARPCRRP